MSFYEIYGLREDGSVFGVVGFQTDGPDQPERDARAYAVAAEYCDKWVAPVRLYQIPEPNLSSTSSLNLWPDDMALITIVYPKRPNRALMLAYRD
jgi:hypothetical protein